MKKGFLAIAIVLFATIGLVQAQESELHGSVDINYLSKYVWRGFDIYGDKSAVQPSINLDLYGTGFGVSLMGHRANSDKYENSERWDYSLYYANSLFEGESYATNYRVAYVYYNYPDNSSHTDDSLDLQELQSVFSWPDILQVKGLVPSYVLVKLSPVNSNSVVGTRSDSGGTASGFVHIFMLDYALPIMCPLSDASRTLNLHSEIIYNDGVGPDGSNVDQDWSNAVFGISTNFDLGNNLILTPGIYHQITMDKSVNPDKDETWISMNLKYKF